MHLVRTVPFARRPWVKQMPVLLVWFFAFCLTGCVAVALAHLAHGSRGQQFSVRHAGGAGWPWRAQ